jgi:hypothetical protein
MVRGAGHDAMSECGVRPQLRVAPTVRASAMLERR